MTSNVKAKTAILKLINEQDDKTIISCKIAKKSGKFYAKRQCKKDKIVLKKLVLQYYKQIN